MTHNKQDQSSFQQVSSENLRAIFLAENSVKIDLFRKIIQLAECLFHIKALNLQDKTFPGLFGVLACIDRAEIIWWTPQDDVEVGSIQRYKIDWDFRRVRHYIESVDSGKKLPIGYEKDCEKSFETFKYFCECMCSIVTNSTVIA